MLAIASLVACSSDPEIITRDVIKEVIKEVTVEVPGKDVIKEVIKEVPGKDVIKEVIKEVTVEVPAAEGPKDTIVFSDLNWTSAQIQNRIAQYIVEHGYGYPTDVIFGGTLPLFQGLKKGDTHVTMEIWLPNQSIGWTEAVELGEVVSVGKSLVGDWQSTFVIPEYLADQYPDLKTPQDLAKPEFQELFATTDSRGKARLVACVPGWSCELVNDAQVVAYELCASTGDPATLCTEDGDSFHLLKPGSQDLMFTELYNAYEEEAPWLGYMWGTGDPALKLDLVRLEEPAYTKECWDSDKACAFDESLVLVAVHKSLLPRAPGVIGFLQNWEFTIDVYKGIFQWKDANPDSTNAEAALEWLNNKSDVWSTWVTADAAASVQEALDAGEDAEGWPDS
jgi:glycine betaine/proline transport system substrate-binding protein